MATARPEDPYKAKGDTGLTADQLRALQQRYRLVDAPDQHPNDLTPAQQEALEVRFGPKHHLSEAERNASSDKYSEGAAETAERDSLKRAEEQSSDGNSAVDKIKQGFLGIEAANRQQGTEAGEGARGGFIRRFFWSSNKRKAATAGGLSGMLATIVAILSFLGFSTGPLEFVHIAKTLTGPFSTLGHVNLASDYRMSRLLYQIYKTGDFSNLDAGDTRLGIVTKALKKPVLEGLAKRGITPEYGTLKTLEGFTVDLSSPNSPYKGLSQEEALTKLQSDLGNSNKLRFTWSEAEPTKIFVSGEGFTGDAAAVRATSAIIAKTYDNWLFGKVASAINSHFMFKYTLANDDVFHYIQRVQLQKTQQIADYIKTWWNDRNATIKDGVKGSTIDTANAVERTQETGPDGKPIVKDTPVPGESGVTTAEGVKAQLGNLKGGLGAAGVIATIVALICVMQAIDHSIGAIRYAQVMLPMMREAMYAISVGSQIMTNQDVDINEVNQIATQFNSYDAQTHHVTSSWSDAAPIESMGGGSGGTDIDHNTKDLFSGAPAILKWTESGAVNALCSGVAQVTAGVVSVAIGIFSGALISTAVGLLAGMLLVPGVIDWISNLVAGATLDPSKLSGAQWGNVIAYGSQLAGNAQAIQYGGVALNNQQVAQLNGTAALEDQAQFHAESLADRIFNPYDYRSIVGSAIDHVDLAGGPQGILATITNLPALFGSLLKIPASLLSATTHAATTPYKYPFPEFGFSQADITNSAVDDPIANAKIVGNLLDNNNTNGEPDYINAALDCFGVAVTKGNDGWDAVPTTNAPTDDAFKQDRTRGVNAYDATYNQGDCIKNNDLNWLRFRMWIYDSRLGNGYNCYMGDEASCANDSVNPNTQVTRAQPAGNGNNKIWLDNGSLTLDEFDGVCDGCKDPQTGYVSYWQSSQCSQASLAEVLNAYNMGKVLAGTANGPSTKGSDPLYKIIDVERVSYANHLWNDLGLNFKSHPGALDDIEGAWMSEADLFKMKVSAYYDTTSTGNTNHLPSDQTGLLKSLDDFITMANNGTPVIVNAPDHWLVIAGGDQNNVYLLDSSPHDFTWADQSTSDSVHLTGPHQKIKVPRQNFISGLDSQQYQYYWGGDKKGKNPKPIAVVLIPAP